VSKGKAIAAAALLAGLLVLVLLRESPPVEIAGQAVDEPAPPADATPSQDAPVLAAAPAAHPLVASPVPSPTAPQPVTSAAPPRSRIFGRVTDLRGVPLVGTDILLGSVGEVWADPATYPDLPDSYSYSTVTDAEGRFSFETPLPSSSWITLHVHAPPFFQDDGRDFGEAGGRRQAPLRPGDNDLGTLRLLDAGVVEGHVRDANGAPLSWALVEAEHSNATGYSINEYSDETGHYVLGGLPAGTHRLSAGRDGCIASSPVSVTVRTGETTRNVDFVLRPAATVGSLAGRVTDQDGAPVPSVDVQAWPVMGGHGGSARTNADGRFEIALSENVPFSLEVEADGFERLPRSDTVNPGTRDIALVLHRQPGVTLRVVDATSRQHIEHYAAAANWSSGLTPGTHAGGLIQIQVPADERYVTVASAGHAPRAYVKLALQAGQDGLAPGTDGVYEIALQPEAAVLGRVLAGGTPQPRPVLRIAAQRLPIAQDDPDYDPVFNNATTDVDSWGGRERRTWGETDGRFRVGELQPGHWELTLATDGTAARTVDFVIEHAGELDLGDIALTRGGVIVGHVVLPAGGSPAGLRVGLDTGSNVDVDRGAVQALDTSGRFRFELVPPGEHQVFVAEAAGLVRSGPGWPVTVQDEHEVEVVLDLLGRSPHRLELSVTANGAPAPGLSVTVETPEGDRLAWFEATDAAGACAGEVDGRGRARLIVRGPHGGPELGRFEATFDPGGVTRRQLDVSAGRLHVRVSPGAMAGHSLGSRFRIGPAGSEEITDIVTAQSTLAPDLFDLGLMPPGRFAISLLGFDSELRGEVEIVAGADAEALLAPVPTGG
jgi:Carboxypeptidase regulatory-like domain